MIEDKTITAVIPVRAGSRRLKNKNILPFGDSNLLIHKIRQLKQVPLIDKIYVSSDSDEMLKMAQSEDVNIHKRPLEYCDEKSKTFNEVVEHIANSLPGDILMWTPCVCPLCTPKNYTDAISAYNNQVIKNEQFDSVVSAESFKKYLYGDGKFINFNPDKHVPSQKLPDWKIIVNGFFIADRIKMINWKFVYGKTPYLCEIDKKAAIDIDDDVDYIVAKTLFGSNNF